MEKREYIIFSDLSVDLAPSFAQKHDIRLIPMNYTIGEEERICRNIEQEAVLKRFYEAQRRGEATQTTQISPDKYIEVFAPLLQEGKAILYLSLSSGLSSTYQSSVIAGKSACGAVSRHRGRVRGQPGGDRRHGAFAGGCCTEPR